MTDVAQPKARRAWSGASLPRGFYAPISFLILTILLEIVIREWNVASYILPPPSAIAARFVEDIRSGDIVWHFGLTLSEVLIGFACALLAGVAIGTAIALIPLVESIVLPYLLAIQTIPKIAIAPLFLIWFGFGLQAKVVSAALLAFFPILVNVISGLKDVDERRILLMRALHAKPHQVFFKMRLPSMLPYLFAGMETGVVFAVLGALVGEFIGGSVGLGAVIIQRQASMDVAGVFSVLICLSCLGMGLNYLVRYAKRRFVSW